ncbi:MAG: BTAD domain-containing putative transcriptional regulator [Ilumatobacteraceae bacterium]
MAGLLEVGLLGSVEVRASGDVVPIAGAKLKAIVALLALSSPHPVSAERLIDGVWDDELPGNPTNSLHAQISSLRRLLGRDAIERRGQGYLLAVGPDDVDTIRFERLVRAGHEAVADDPATAVQHFAAALSLVRGPVLGDITEFRFARETAARLDELVSGAHEGLVDGRLAIGEHTAVVGELTALVQHHPLHERFHAQLVIALYRCGRQADALQAYHQARRVLLEELGVEPCPELRALEVAILRQDPTLDAPAFSAPQPSRTAGPTSAARDGSATRFALVGRGGDVAALRADLASVRTGRGRVALVGGEPGVGKTRLVEEIADDAVAAGAVVAWGRCYEGRGAPAFWPWVQIVGDLIDRFDRLDRAVVADAVRTTAGDLAQVLPAVKEFAADLEPPPPEDPESARFRLGQAITTTVRRLARHRPVVVVLDDLHWADPASLDVLAVLAGTLAEDPILALGTFRDVGLAGNTPLSDALVELSRRPTTRRLDLSGLDLESLADLVAMTGSELDDVALDAVHRRTNGNPFFVIELLRHTPGGHEQRRDGDPIGTPIPHGVKGVVRQRVQRLPEPTIRTVTFAAALGQAFDLAVLAASLDVDGATLLDHLEPALSAGLVVDSVGRTSRYRFAHGLVNETIYQDLGPAQRARTHHLIAQALDDHHGDSTGPHVLEAAAHWSRAVPAAPVAVAVEHALEAATWGATHVAHQEAIDQLHVALGLIADLPEGHERAVLELRVQDQLSGLLIAATSYTDPEFGRVCDRIRELSLRVEDHALLAPALWRLSVHHFMRCDISAGLETSGQLLDLAADVAPGPARVAGHLALGLVNHVRGDQLDARRHFAEAVALCDAGHDAGLARAVTEAPGAFGRTFAAIVTWLVGDEDGAERQARENVAREAQRDIGSWATMVSMWGASTVSMLCGDAATTLQRCDEGIALARAGGYGLGIPYMTVNRGWAIAVLGDPAAGEAGIVEGTLMAEAFGAEYLRGLFRAARAEVCLLAGRPEDALAAVDEGLLIIAANGDRCFEAELRRLRGQALAAEGVTAEATGDVQTAISVATAQGALGLARRADACLARFAVS